METLIADISVEDTLIILSCCFAVMLGFMHGFTVFRLR
jgi:hypothetical protein